MKRVVAAVPLVVYAWLATGVKPFTPLAYALIAVPAATCLLAYGVRGGFTRVAGDRYRAVAATVTLGSLRAWLAIAVVATALEVAGLALGGRSVDVPTLSTAADHLLTTHPGRAILYLAWLAIGISPIVRLGRGATAR